MNPIKTPHEILMESAGIPSMADGGAVDRAVSKFTTMFGREPDAQELAEIHEHASTIPHRAKGKKVERRVFKRSELMGVPREKYHEEFVAAMGREPSPAELEKFQELVFKNALPDNPSVPHMAEGGYTPAQKKAIAKLDADRKYWDINSEEDLQKYSPEIVRNILAYQNKREPTAKEIYDYQSNLQRDVRRSLPTMENFNRMMAKDPLAKDLSAKNLLAGYIEEPVAPEHKRATGFFKPTAVREEPTLTNFLKNIPTRTVGNITPVDMASYYANKALPSNVADTLFFNPEKKQSATQVIGTLGNPLNWPINIAEGLVNKYRGEMLRDVPRMIEGSAVAGLNAMPFFGATTAKALGRNMLSPIKDPLLYGTAAANLIPEASVMDVPKPVVPGFTSYDYLD